MFNLQCIRKRPTAQALIPVRQQDSVSAASDANGFMLMCRSCLSSQKPIFKLNQNLTCLTLLLVKPNQAAFQSHGGLFTLSSKLG